MNFVSQRSSIVVQFFCGLLAAYGGLIPSAEAQPPSPYHLETGFSHNVSRYSWSAELNVVQPVRSGLFFLHNRLDSEALVLGTDNLLVRDDNRTRWLMSYPLNPDVDLHLKGNTLIYSQNRVLSQDVLAGPRYSPTSWLVFEPLVGFAWDRRAGALDSLGQTPLKIDSGPAFLVSVSGNPPLDPGRELSVTASGAWQNISPRTGYTARAESAFNRSDPSSDLSVQVRYATMRRDTYQSASFLNRDTARPAETIEATLGDTLQAIVQLVTPITTGLRLQSSLDFSTNARKIRTLQAPGDAIFFDTNLNRRSLTADLGVTYSQDVKNASLGLRWGAELEDRRLVNRESLPVAQAALKGALLQKTNFDRGYFALTGGARWPLTRRSFLHLEGTSSILRHDTPDTNPDDRDEVFHTGQARIATQIFPWLDIAIELLGTFYHTVYLKSERSGENNTQRTIRFRPSVRWAPSEATSIQFTPEIRAAYTVDDFVLEGRRPNDQSARELRYELNAERSFGNATSMIMDASYSDLRLGRLLWDEFAEIPFDTVQTVSGWLRVQTGSKIASSFGFRWFFRSDFDRASTIVFPRLDDLGQPVLGLDGEPETDFIVRPARQIVQQAGPSSSMLFQLSKESSVRVDGWLQIQKTWIRIPGSLPEESAERIRKAAGEGTRRIIPNISLTVDWWI